MLTFVFCRAGAQTFVYSPNHCFPHLLLFFLKGEYIKAAAAKKGAEAMAAHPTPFRVAEECAVLAGVGQGTVEKLAAFLKTYGKPEPGIAGELAEKQKKEGKDEEFKWVEESERDVLLDMLREGQVTFDKVGCVGCGSLWALCFVLPLLLTHIPPPPHTHSPWRTDIKEGDW